MLIRLQTLPHFFLDFIRDILRNSPDSYDARDVIMECLPYTPLAEWSGKYRVRPSYSEANGLQSFILRPFSPWRPLHSTIHQSLSYPS